MTIQDWNILEKIFCSKNQFLSKLEGDISLNPNAVYILKSKNEFNLSLNYQSKKYYTINNKDKSIRWIFSDKLSEPLFLKFYNQSTFKAKLFSYFIQFIFIFRLQKYFIDDVFFVLNKQKNNIDEIVRVECQSQFAIFTGTVGENRKAILFVKNDIDKFYKIPITKNATQSIKNEIEQIVFFEKINNQFICLPIVDSQNEFNSFSSVKTHYSTRSNSLTSLHFDYYFEQEKLTLNASTFSETDLFTFYSKKTSLTKVDMALQLLFQTIDITQTIEYVAAHGDFTSWNIYINKNKLGLYDFEYAGFYPRFFDLIHFIVQQSVMIDFDLPQVTFEKVKLLLQKLENNIVSKTNLEIYLKLYILQASQLHLAAYQQQNDLHFQAKNLISFWHYAANYFIKDSVVEFRQAFVDDLFQQISLLPYALLKRNVTITSLAKESDLDILIKKENYNQLKQFLESSPFIEKNVVENYFGQIVHHIYFLNGEYLRIDFLTEFSVRNCIIESIENVLQQRVSIDGFYYIAIYHEIEYLLFFYRLNNAFIAEKHINRLSLIDDEQKRNSVTYFKQKYGHAVSSFSSIFKLKKQNFAIEYSILQRVKKMLNTIIKAKNNAGIIITFTGVDGAGKSTVINDFTTILTEKYRMEVVYKRSRPHIFPIISALKYGKQDAELKSISTLPRQGTNDSIISSVLRFAYYYIDFFVGQWYDRFRYTWRGKIIVYDRYYFDYIFDLKRMNITLPAWFSEFFYTFLLKPNLNVFLYADPQVILSRKKEMNVDDIKIVQDCYLNFFNEQKTISDDRIIYLPIENNHLQHTLNVLQNYYIKLAV